MASEDLFNFPDSDEIILSTQEQIGDVEPARTENNKENIFVEADKETEVDIDNTSLDQNLDNEHATEIVLEECNNNINTATKELVKSVNQQKPNEPKQIQLPLSKIRSIMKLDPDLVLASNEAVFTITKATEMFINSLAKESYLFTNQAKKKTIQKQDVTLAISSVDSLTFLEGAMDF